MSASKRPRDRGNLSVLVATLGVYLVAPFAAVATGGCSGAQEHPPPLFESFDEDAAVVDAFEGPRFEVSVDSAINCSSDAAGICACKLIGQKPTSLYLVLDRSGSMREVVPPATMSKWDVVRLALLDQTTGVLRKLGSRLAIGAARFPASSGDTCGVGSEILDLRIGSFTTYNLLAGILATEKPQGGTPTAATLAALAPKLKTLPKPLFVLLATDGGPNCGTTPCAADRCILNIEKVSPKCSGALNCCDPLVAPEFGGSPNCLDSEATKAVVKDLAAHDIKVFVVGVPGSEFYARDLDDLAVAGGTARDGSPKYYAASDPASLTQALQSIAAKVVDTCVIALENPIADPGFTNVLLDSDLIAQSDTDGWSWTDMSHSAVRLNGASCARIKTDSVSSVQVAVGCKTVTR
ncbi:MAG: hypothetical protein NVS3B20_20080 [Polyangiales bacterium]